MKEADSDATANKEEKISQRVGGVKKFKKKKPGGFTDVGGPAEYKANSGKQSN